MHGAYVLQQWIGFNWHATVICLKCLDKLSTECLLVRVVLNYHILINQEAYIANPKDIEISVGVLHFHLKYHTKNLIGSENKSVSY